MKQKISVFLLLCCLFISSATFAQSDAAKPSKGVVRVKLQPEMARQLEVAILSRSSNGIVATGVTQFDAASRKVKAAKMRRVFPYAEKFEGKYQKFGLDRWYEIIFDESVNPLEAKKIYAGVAGVQIAENVVPMELKEDKGKFRKVTVNNISAPKAGVYPFNDPQLSSQWHYYNNGSMTGSVAGADINLFNAWKINSGSKDVLVAIVDGGVDYKHEDLAGNMHVNSAEFNGAPGVDDDGNGYVDDIYVSSFTRLLMKVEIILVQI